MTVEQLRKDGWNVRVTHERCYSNIETELENGMVLYGEYAPPVSFERAKEIGAEGILARGGCTKVRLEKDGVTLEGEAHCNPTDNFNRKLGVKIALGRALLAYSEKERRKVPPKKRVGFNG